jgi:hypothetical protein
MRLNFLELWAKKILAELSPKGTHRAALSFFIFVFLSITGWLRVKN